MEGPALLVVDDNHTAYLPRVGLRPEAAVDRSRLLVLVREGVGVTGRELFWVAVRVFKGALGGIACCDCLTPPHWHTAGLE